MLKSFVLTAVFSVAATVATAHEYWIDPLVYSIPSGGGIVADIKNGQDFKGSRFPYFKRDYVKFDHIVAGRKGKLRGRDGDYPAIQVKNAKDGLHVFSMESTFKSVSYEKLFKFDDFLDSKGLSFGKQLHRDRGLPDSKFREGYTRFVKSLVGVGSARGSDEVTGLEMELVAMDNPYTMSGNSVEFLLLYKFKPLPNHHVDLYIRNEGANDLKTFKTDANGRVTLPVQRGKVYLVNAVVLREPSSALAEEKDIVWETLWASSTFGTAK